MSSGLGTSAGGSLRRAPVVSVVIPAYRRTEMLRQAVLSLFDQDLEKDAYEIIVVDSSPDDRNLAAMKELQGSAPCSLRCLRKAPEGPGPSRNLGVREARGQFIAFMDSDCRATPGWLRHGLAAFADGVGLVQGRTGPDAEGPPGVFTWYVSVERENYAYEACNIFYRRQAFEQAGGFPADLSPRADHPMGGEDTEVAWKVKRLGWQTRFAPSALVHHEVVPISVWRWLFTKNYYVLPALTKRFPELRQFFYARYFYSRAHAAFLLALAGIALAGLKPAWLALGIPYVLLRAAEPTRTLYGIRRPLRVAAYAPRDALAFLVLLAGSIRYRSLLL